jgi:threonine/homoserine/homoserine lactone efflux protein
MTTFLLASLLLGLSPGPGVLYIVTTSVVHGRRAGLVSAAAMAAGNLVMGLAVASALTALLGVSGTFFTVLRYAGAAWLVYLGARMILARSQASLAEAATVSAPRAFRDALLVALMNPKTLVFFAAFLPQFMDPADPSLLQGALLALVFVLIALVTDCGYAVAAGWIARPLHQSRRAQGIARWLGGGLLVCLGMLVLLR